MSLFMGAVILAVAVALWSWQADGQPAFLVWFALMTVMNSLRTLVNPLIQTQAMEPMGELADHGGRRDRHCHAGRGCSTRQLCRPGRRRICHAAGCGLRWLRADRPRLRLLGPATPTSPRHRRPHR